MQASRRIRHLTSKHERTSLAKQGASPNLKQNASRSVQICRIWRRIALRIDPSVVRGLEYYTGPVFECELLMETKDEDGKPVRFGSVGGGGRYDDLVARFTGQQVPATGFSIGVSRLYSALKLVGKAEESATLAPVVVLVMDKDRQGDYWRMVQELRAAGIRAEMYVGTAGMKAQMKYADKRGARWSSSRAATRRPRAKCRSRICGWAPTRQRHRIARGICRAAPGAVSRSPRGAMLVQMAVKKCAGADDGAAATFRWGDGVGDGR